MTNEETKEYMRKYRDNNREKVRQYSRDWRIKNKEWDIEQNRLERERLKLEVISHYSNGTMCCGGCGYSDIRALQIDHVNDDGANKRRATHGKRTAAGADYYRWIRQHNFPKGYQVLCANCNWIKEIERRRRKNTHTPSL